MIEQKYKAWHKYRKEMYDVYGFTKDYVFRDTMDGIGCDGNPDKREDVIFLQFTGFKDRNNTDIYHGYILKGKNYGEDIITAIEWIQSYEGDGFPVSGFYSEIDALYMNDPVVLNGVIIGNVYQNPELLEIKNDNN